jgi:membrane fusion protein, multidrug efflux system
MRYRLAFCLAALALLCGCKKQNAYFAPPPPEVGVAHPLARKVTPYLDATGNATAYNQVDLVARVQGFVQSIDYRDGSFVKTGTKLFVIEPAPYQAKLQQAQAGLDGAKATAAQAQAEYQRQSVLVQRNVSSQSTYDQAKATYQSDQANVLNQTAGVALAGINLGYTNVVAPFDGVVTSHLVSVGDLVGSSAPTRLASIVQLDPIYVNFNVSEQDVLRVRDAAHKTSLTPEQMRNIQVYIGLMNETGYPHVGHLDYISPEVNPATGTLAVRAVFNNPDRLLLPGFFVRVRIPLNGQAAQALLVPDTALGTDQAGRYLLIVDNNNVVQQRTVHIGQLDGTLRVITSGLQPDDAVVITGLQRAIPGGKVTPQPAQMPES